MGLNFPELNLRIFLGSEEIGKILSLRPSGATDEFQMINENQCSVSAGAFWAQCGELTGGEQAAQGDWCRAFAGQEGVEGA